MRRVPEIVIHDQIESEMHSVKRCKSSLGACDTIRPVVQYRGYRAASSAGLPQVSLKQLPCCIRVAQPYDSKLVPVAPALVVLSRPRQSVCDGGEVVVWVEFDFEPRLCGINAKRSRRARCPRRAGLEVAGFDALEL